MPPPIQVLLIDDDRGDYLLTRDLLAEIEGDGYALEWAGGYEQGLEAIRGCRHDVYLLDYHLGERNGVELLHEAVESKCKAPLILLTGHGGRDLDVTAMKAGAADYLPKDRLNAALLERSIRYALERKRAEEALRQSEEKLRQAQKMEAVGRLAGGVAHDFNNMLTAIIGYSEVLLRQSDPGTPTCDGLLEIKKAGERAAALTQQLLAFSRRQVLQARVLDLNAVVTDMEPMLRRIIGEDVHLVVAAGADLRPVKADPGQLQQVVLNLAVNARDAMPRGGFLTIATAGLDVGPSAATHGELRAGPYAVLTVSDTGCGMDDAVKAHLFEPFFTTKEAGKGAGLGLALVYGVVRASGGHIEVESEPGRGATVRIFLPGAAEAAPMPERPGDFPEVARGKETVLLTEDEPSVRRLVEMVLARAGYTVLEASHGAEALEVSAVHEGPIHLLVTDVIMPHMSGQELAGRLTRVRPGLKVLFISGYTGDALKNHGLEETGGDLLVKPFTPTQLTQTVRALLDR